MFSLFRNTCLLYKPWKIVFSQFVFTIYNIGIQGVTRAYRRLQGVRKGYKGLQGVSGGYKGLQGVPGGDRGYRGLPRIIETFFLTRTFRDTLSWSILHKNQS